MAGEQLELGWDDEQKGEVVNYIRTLGDKTRDYFSSAIQYANEQRQETPEEFWRKLFYERKTPHKEPIQREKGDYQRRKAVRQGELTPEEAGVLLPDVCPADPYHELDFQALCKFLQFGGDRNFPEGEKDDSENFYDVFRFHDRFVPQKDYESAHPDARKYGDNRGVYMKQLHRAFELRNGKMAHTSTGTQRRITWDALEDAVATFEFLTAQMQRTDGWMPRDLLPLKEFWRRIRGEITKKFGSAPLSLLELGQEVFATERLSPGQQAQLDEISDSLNLDCRNGMAYQQPDRNKLLGIMRGMYELLLRGECASAEMAVAAREEQDRKERERETAMRQAEEREERLTAPPVGPRPPEGGQAPAPGGDCAPAHAGGVDAPPGELPAPGGRDAVPGRGGTVAAAKAPACADGLPHPAAAGCVGGGRHFPPVPLHSALHGPGAGGDGAGAPDRDAGAAPEAAPGGQERHQGAAGPAGKELPEGAQQSHRQPGAL